MHRLARFAIAFGAIVGVGILLAGNVALWVWMTDDNLAVTFFGSVTTACALTFGTIAAISE